MLTGSRWPWVGAARKLSDWKGGGGAGSEDWRTRLGGQSDQESARNLGRSDCIRGRRINDSH